jgi:hypothetical protein
MNPIVKRNYIKFIFSVLEFGLIKTPELFFDEFMIFLNLEIADLKDQAEQSVAENDPIFTENFLGCYLRLPEFIIQYQKDAEKMKTIIDTFIAGCSNQKLSIYQLCVILKTMNLIAFCTQLPIASSFTSFFKLDLSTKKYELTV